MLTSLLRAPEAVIDLWKGTERQLVGVIIDSCEGVRGNADLCLLGGGFQGLTREEFGALLERAEAITQSGPKSSLEISLSPGHEEQSAWLLEAGYQLAYSMYRMERPGGLPLQAPRAALPVDYSWEALSPARLLDYYQVLKLAFAKVPGAQLPPLEEMSAHALKSGPQELQLLIDGRQVRGFARVKSAGDEAEVYSIGRDPSCVGMGLGDHILLKALQMLQAKKPTRISLGVAASNEGALSLYRRHDFKLVQAHKIYERALR